jgi:hypothetical protein
MAGSRRLEKALSASVASDCAKRNSADKLIAGGHDVGGRIAKILKHVRSQTVRLPLAFRPDKRQGWCVAGCKRARSSIGESTSNAARLEGNGPAAMAVPVQHDRRRAWAI